MSSLIDLQMNSDSLNIRVNNIVALGSITAGSFIGPVIFNTVTGTPNINLNATLGAIYNNSNTVIQRQTSTNSYVSSEITNLSSAINSTAYLTINSNGSNDAFIKFNQSSLSNNWTIGNAGVDGYLHMVNNNTFSTNDIIIFSDVGDLFLEGYITCYENIYIQNKVPSQTISINLTNSTIDNNSNSRLTLLVTGNNDPYINFIQSGITNWFMGVSKIDNKFHLNGSGSFSSNDSMILDGLGNVNFKGSVTANRLYISPSLPFSTMGYGYTNSVTLNSNVNVGSFIFLTYKNPSSVIVFTRALNLVYIIPFTSFYVSGLAGTVFQYWIIN